MNIKKQVPKFISALLSFSMAFGTVIPAYATEITTESLLEEVELNETEVETAELEDAELNEPEVETNEIEVQADSEGMYEEIEVNYSQASTYFVTIPKTITLGTDKKSPYSIKVSGDIAANKQVCVVPVDGITDTEVFDFYMKDQTAGSTKADVVAEVSQAKFYWNHEDAKAGYEENDNYIIADDLSAGKWKGTFQMEISMRTDPSHIHNYVGEVTKEPTCTEEGEKTYTCDCGDSYTETIDPTGHHYEHGECTNCGEKDPNHEHKYTEEVTKEPTCTEEGEKTYTCDCGDSYTEKIPAKGHNYENGTCTDCGDKDPDAHEHSYSEEITKEATCTEAGEKTYTCECGDSYSEVIPATGHNYVDGECEHCGEKDPDAHEHQYTEEITKEATCIEAGEKTYTCECGDSYSEVIPATGHHYEDNISSWENTSNGTYVFVQDGTKWTSNNQGINSSTATSTWTISVTEDTEYSFIYKVSSEPSYDKLTITLDSTTVANAIHGAGSEITYTTTLSAGTHTLTATYTKDSSQSKNNDCGYLILCDIGNNNHICTGCKNVEEHNYLEEIIKEPTCTDDGEKVYTCSECGKSYTEVIPTYGSHIDENDDDICDRCGHEHIWEENTDSISWIKNFNSSSIVQNGNTWKAWYNTSNQYSQWSLNGYWNITVPNDMEYTFNYNSGFLRTDDIVRIYVDGETIVNFSDSAKSGSETISLTEGTHTIRLLLSKQNKSTTSTYASITLKDIEIYNHICTECGKKEAHHYADGIITKEPTCTEKGEKAFICTKCNATRTEEIDALGHHYVDGVCSRCGNLNLVSTEIWSATTSTSTTADSGGGHYDKSYLAGTYSPNIEITEDMSEDEYLLLHFYVGYPYYNGTGNIYEGDGINGSAMLQKYDEETRTWKNIYSYSLTYDTIDTDMIKSEGGYHEGAKNGIKRRFQLEKGTYRAYGNFSANRNCGSSVAHYYYSYRISVSLCQIEKEEVAETL